MPKPVFSVTPATKQRALRYPGRDNAMDLREHLRGSIWRAFSARTIALTALFTTGIASTANRIQAADEEEKKPVAVDMDKVHEVIKKYLGKEVRFDDEDATRESIPADSAYVELLQKTVSSIPSNPDYYVGIETLVDDSKAVPLKGAVACTVVNEATLLKAAKELFAIYGVNLQDNAAFDSGKVTFEVDGFDKTKNIGIELASSTQAYYAFDGAQWAEAKETDDQFLAPEEMKGLDELVKKNKANVLVLPRESYTQQGVSEFIITKAFLRSVFDYLEWLRASGKL